MKNLEVSIPKHSEADVVNEKPLRKSIFTRTRIAALSLLMILALGVVGGTIAYLGWTNNQTPNRETMGDVEVEIVEVNTDKNGTETTLDTETSTTNDANAAGGTQTKKVKLKSDEDPNRVEEVVRVQFVPEVESKQNSGSNVAITEFWGKGVQGNSTDGFYLETSVLKLWIASDWADHWVYNNGAFYYNKVINKGEETPVLLTGVTLQDSVNKSDYASFKVKVVADALQVTPKAALDDWGIKVTDNADGKTKDVAIKGDDDE